MRTATGSAVLACAVVATAAAAQRIEPARVAVEGVVYDSLALRPLPGATVQLRRLDSIPADNSAPGSYVAVTDGRGRFHLETIPAGRYVGTSFHVSLDSLGLEAPLREFRVAGAGSNRLSLAVPSARTIVTTLCGAGGVSDSTGTLMGFVRDATTLTGVDRASVIVQWTRVIVGRERVSLEYPEAAALTRDNGWYALCNVPIGLPIRTVAASGGDTSGTVEFLAVAAGLARADLYVGESEQVAGRADLILDDSLPGAPSFRRGPARLNVRVSSSSGLPVRGARVMVPGTGAMATTNDLGTSALVDLPAGSRMLEVRALGFVPVREPVHLLVQQDPNEVEIVLTSLQAFLDTIRVTGRRVFSSDATGFERRQHAGLGRYFDRNAIDRMRPFRTTDLFRAIPSVSFVPAAFGESTIWMRGINGKPCRPAVYLDGFRFGSEDIDLLTIPDDLEGVELYVRAVEAPGQYTDFFSGCGSVVLWTRRFRTIPRR